MERLKQYKFIEQIKALPFVEELWLFGSRARGDNKEKSDIDLAVVCKENTKNSDWLDVCDIIDDADTLLSIDFVRFDTLKESEFKNRILKEKVVL